MTIKTINLSDFAKEVGNYTKERIPEFRQAAAVGIAKSIPELVRQSPVDTGLYASSWDMTVEEMQIILGNYAPHAPIIELGARPFKPPIQPLLEWAKRVLQDPSQPPEYSSNVWSLARYTQQKIERQGIRPRHIMEKNIPMIIENIKAEFEKLG